MEAREERSSPVVPHVVLLVAFLLLTATGIVTVLLPALEEDPDGVGQNAALEPTE